MRKPNWLLKPLPNPEDLRRMRGLLRDLDLHTICESGNCPNLGECWGEATATFLILGNICTRDCGFCDVEPGSPLPLDAQEPFHVAKAVQALELSHVVITSVTRDDLADGGAAHFAQTIRAVRQRCPQTAVEVLVPDYVDDEIEQVLAAHPAVFGHNIETVRNFHTELRPGFDYDLSLAVLAQAKKMKPGIYTKSSIMVGLGETADEVREALEDLRSVGCDFVTIGQYLQPSRQHTPVEEYVEPAIFARYKKAAEEMGFSYVASGPFVRSSYRAAAALQAARPPGCRQYLPEGEVGNDGYDCS